jgi:hypothetical protein
LQHGLGFLVCLCEHCGTRLDEDLVLHEVYHLCRHVGVPDTGFRRLQILRADIQPLSSFLQPILIGAKIRSLFAYYTERRVDYTNCPV